MSASVHPLEDTLERLRQGREKAFSDLVEIAAIPSISNEPGFDVGIQQAAKWFVDKLSAAGVPELQLVSVPRANGKGLHNPIIVGKDLRAGPGKPTILLYFHTDVQSGGEGWTETEPFVPKVVGKRIYGRGVGDNKGPAVALLHALSAMLQNGGVAPVNYIILAEGEEEHGGEGIALFIENPAKYGDFGTLFDNLDCAFIPDVEMADDTRPGLVFGLRGIVYYKLHVSGPAVTCHSGLRGGLIQCPAEALAKMLAAVRDPRTGEILVPGFMDGAKPLTEVERKLLEACPIDMDLCGAPALMNFSGQSPAAQLGALPTFTVHGTVSGHVAGDKQTGLAAIAAGTPTKIFPDAWALCSNRIVGGQDPDHVVECLRRFFEEFARNELQGTVTVEMEVFKSSRGIRFDPSVLPIRLAGEAMQQAWGAPPGIGMGGGSIPVVQAFVDNIGIPAVLWGGTPINCGMHGPNEFLTLADFHTSAEGMVRYFHLLGNSVN